ncbi:MAG: alpha-mannosidase [Lachnospiraceae bacterium]|nr:alpha-mannosidase [Lachnospiraceae bacterium]
MFWTEPKLKQRIAEVCSLRYRDLKKVTPMLVKEDCSGLARPELPVCFDGWESVEEKYRWAGRDLYLWLHTEIEIPAEWTNKAAVGVFDFGITGDGNNTGFESLLYVNGEPYQAVDLNHKEVFFKEEHTGKKLDLTFRLWSGLEGGGVPRAMEHEIKFAQFGWLDPYSDDLYYLADMMLQTAQILNDNDPVKGELVRALDRAFMKIDWSEPGSEEYYASVQEADEFLNAQLDAMDKKSAVNVICVGHTHIDTAWLWRLKHTREKASRSFSTVLRLMEQFPEYIFLQTQPQIYAYIKEDFPEIYEKIKAKVAEGRWEPDGAMWVEADCNLTSGESLTRQILLGTKFFKEEFGTEPHYLWLPDVFGYSWALPQILKKSGIDMFMTTKISWNQFNRMPSSTFKWKGIDGSEVLAHFITTPNVGQSPDTWGATYNGQLLPETVKGVWDKYEDKEINQDLLISYGFGDGGGGVNRDNLERHRRMDKIPGLPNVKTGTATDYFEKLKETIKNTDQYVHEWDGELYLEYHRGTYTSQAYNKLMNRKMELLYRQAEWFTLLDSMMGENSILKAQQEKLDDGWRQILTHQFHDIIPGSSIREVYEDSHVNYAAIEKNACEVIDDFKQTAGLCKVEGDAECYTVFNDSAWNLGGMLLIPNQKEGSVFVDDKEQELESQYTKEGTYVYLNSVPAAGAEIIYRKDGEIKEVETDLAAAKSEEGIAIETPFYSAVINNAGQLERLYDKENDREVLAKGQRGNVFQIFEDKPLNFDAWDVDIYFNQKMEEITNVTSLTVEEVGNLRLVIHAEWEYRKSKIAQDIIFYAKDRRIDFVTNADYQETHKLLKTAFPVDIRSTYATYDVQYGNVRRPNNWNTSWDYARFESCAHRWVDLSERNYGVSLLNNCKYGHDVYGNVIRLTLIKSANNPDYAADKGAHAFTYSLLPHTGDFVEAGTVKEAYRLNQPLCAFEGKAALPFADSFVAFDNDQVELDAIKCSEDGKYIVVRFHEYTGSKQKVSVKPGFAYKAWAESDLMERAKTAFAEGEIKLTVNPYEIVTLLFEI